MVNIVQGYRKAELFQIKNTLQSVYLEELTKSTILLISVHIFSEELRNLTVI